MMRDQRRLAAIVSADVAGYSRLMGRDDSDTLARLKAHRRELIDPKIAEYGGRIVKTTGDGLLLEFPSIVDAVRCAVDVQRGMAERNATVPPEQRIEFRIGINVGDIIIDGDDIFGDGVNVAARVQTLAEPGGICTSKVVRDQVLDKLSFAFEDLGAQQVKNIARPVEVYRVDLGSGSLPPPSSGFRRWQRLMRARRWRWLAAGVVAFGLTGIAFWAPQFWKSAPILTASPFSTAILPLAAPSGSPADVQLADRLSQDLTTVLGREGHIASRGAVAAYAGKPVDARSVGRDLNVGNLVEGEVTQSDGKVAVSLRLVDTITGAQTWSYRTDFDASQLTADPALMLMRVGSHLRVAINRIERDRALLRPSSRDPLDVVFRGDAARASGTSMMENVVEMRKLYDEALRINPNYAPALLGRAYTLHWEMYENPAADHARMVEELDTLTRRAIAADDNNPWAWLWRADALAWLGRLDEALAAVDRVPALDPTWLSYFVEKSWLMWLMGRPADALAVAQRGVQIDPPGSTDTILMICRANLLLGRYGDAVPACEKGTTFLDASWRNYVLLMVAYAQHGDSDKAALTKVELLKRQPGYTIAKDKASRFSDNPEFVRQLDEYFYPGLRKAGLPEE